MSRRELMLNDETPGGSMQPITIMNSPSPDSVSLTDGYTLNQRPADKITTRMPLGASPGHGVGRYLHPIITQESMDEYRMKV